jgi:hypothetical protein
MKKIYYVIKYLILIIIALLVFFFSDWEQIIINLVLINITIYFIRKPLIALAAYIFKKRFYRAIISITINLTWVVFLFWLLFFLSQPLFFALVPFIIVAISLNFKNIINNIASGVLLLASEQFEVGDLIEINDIQGIVKEINLNYTKIKEFDGVEIIMQNNNIYGSTVIKFTHSKFKTLKKMKKKDFEKKKYYRRYMKAINRIIKSKIKTTKYVKQVEIIGSVDPEGLEEHLSKVFDKYEPIFGIRPSFSIDHTTYGRVRTNLYIMSEKPILVVNYIDAFLRDLVFELNSDEVFLDWPISKKQNKSTEKESVK